MMEDQNDKNPIDNAIDVLIKEKRTLQEKIRQIDMAVSSLRAVKHGVFSTSPEVEGPFLKNLGPYSKMGLEEAVLTIVNSASHKWTVHDIIEKLENGGMDLSDRKSKYASVYTPLRRLAKKGHIEKAKVGGETVFRRLKEEIPEDENSNHTVKFPPEHVVG